MSLERSFYFVRHGETDHNYHNILTAKEEDVPLNARGLQQSEKLHPHISKLPISSVCHSPLSRAKDTAKIITKGHDLPFFEIEELKECTGTIWKEIIEWDREKTPPLIVEEFLEQAINGMHKALEFENPLIVAHGGVHWALCYYMGLSNHDWLIANCGLVHFNINVQGKWKANLLV